MPIYYDAEEVKKRLEFHENKAIELELTGADPALLEIHKKQVRRFRSFLIKSTINEKVDISKFTLK